MGSQSLQEDRALRHMPRVQATCAFTKPSKQLCCGKIRDVQNSPENLDASSKRAGTDVKNLENVIDRN